MTEQYNKDMTALAAMIAVLPNNLIDPQLKQYTKLKLCLADVYAKAAIADTHITATAAAYDAVFADDKASIDADAVRRSLKAIRIAGKGRHKSRLELVASLIERGKPGAAGLNDNQWLGILRASLEGDKAAPHHANKTLLRAAASTAADKVTDLCDYLKKDVDGLLAAPPVFGSAVDLLLPIAKVCGLAPEHVATLEAMREAISSALGGGEGSTVWPSTYVSSSSSGG
jgi:hypothetical protein